MRIAFCGKGGSGKSTLTSLTARYLAHIGAPVLVMDGDINQHLGRALGFSETELAGQIPMGSNPNTLHNYVRGTNPRIASDDLVTENTPAGSGSGLIDFAGDNDVARKYEIKGHGLRFVGLGGHNDDQVGATCYHNFTHKMGTYLNHLIDGASEYFIGDMCAGADPFAGALASKFDVVFLVVEPTEKSVGVFDQCKAYAEPFGTPIYVIGNKIEDDSDLEFIRARVGDALIGYLKRSDFVRQQEKGIFQDISMLEQDNIALLQQVKTITDSIQKDWTRYRKNNLHFLEKAAKSWADALYETDIMAQIDPDFRQEDYMTRKQESKAA